jgi:hypothetical protein
VDIEQGMTTMASNRAEPLTNGTLRSAEVATGTRQQPPADPPEGVTYPDWAAYTLVARVILNLDETITKE